MTLRKRIARLEAARPVPKPPLEVHLAPDLAQRVTDAMAAGTYPASMSTADLREVRAAILAAEGGHG